MTEHNNILQTKCLAKEMFMPVTSTELPQPIGTARALAPPSEPAVAGETRVERRALEERLEEGATTAGDEGATGTGPRKKPRTTTTLPGETIVGHVAATEAWLEEERASDQHLSEMLEKLRADVEDFAERLGTYSLGSFAGLPAESAKRKENAQKKGQ